MHSIFHYVHKITEFSCLHKTLAATSFFLFLLKKKHSHLEHVRARLVFVDWILHLVAYSTSLFISFSFQKKKVSFFFSSYDYWYICYYSISWPLYWFCGFWLLTSMSIHPFFLNYYYYLTIELWNRQQGDGTKDCQSSSSPKVYACIFVIQFVSKVILDFVFWRKKRSVDFILCILRNTGPNSWINLSFGDNSPP